MLVFRILYSECHEQHVHIVSTRLEHIVLTIRDFVRKLCAVKLHRARALRPCSVGNDCRGQVAVDDGGTARVHRHAHRRTVRCLRADDARDRQRRCASLEQRHVSLHPDGDGVVVAGEGRALRRKGAQVQRHDVHGVRLVVCRLRVRCISAGTSRQGAVAGALCEVVEWRAGERGGHTVGPELV